MSQKIRLSSLFLVLLALSGSAWAVGSSKTVVLSGGTNLGVGLYTTSSSPITVSGTLGLGLGIAPFLELTTRTTAAYILNAPAAGSSTVSLLALGGATLVLGERNNAFHLSGLAGINYAAVNPGAATTSFAYGGEIGKRFALTDSVAWNPTVSMLMTTATGATPFFQITPFQFAVFF